MLRFLPALAFYLLQFARVDAIVPYAGFEETYLYNGVPSTKHTLLFTCTESDPVGQLIVGDYSVNVTCVPPAYHYRYVEIGRVPRRTKLNINKNCLVNDVAQYQASSAQSQAELGFNSSSISASDDSAAGSRSTQSIFNTIGKYFTAGPDALAQVTDLKNSFDGFIKGSYASTLSAVGDLTKVTANLNAQAALQQDQIDLVANSTNVLFQQQQSQQYELNYVNNTVNAIAAESKKSFDQLNGQLTSYAASVNAQFSASNAQLRDALVQASNNTAMITSQIQFEIDSIVRQGLSTNQIIQNLAITLTQQIRNIQQDRSTVKAYFASLDNMDPSLMPFTLGQGIRPAAKLVGADKRFLVERFDYNWVTPTVGSGSASRYQIYNSQMRIYVDSLWALDNAQFFSGVDQLNMLFSSGKCNRAYSDADSPQEGGLPACKIWAEIRTYVCTSSNISPKLSWKLDGNTSIPLPYCQSTPTLATNGPLVIKDFTSFYNYFATTMCTQQDGPYKITVQRLQAQTFHAPNITLCQSSWKIQRYTAEVNGAGASLLYRSLALTSSALSSALIDLFKLELKLFGRNPGGLKYERKPNDYVPTNYNGTTPVYDGGAKSVDCTYTSWLGVDRLTVPLYAVDPLANPTVSKAVHLSIDGPVCTDPDKCYPVGQSDVTQNIALNNDASNTLPASFLMAGFVDDVTQGIWDIPSRSLSGSAQTQERANTPSYILMPPGQENTDGLAEWIGRNTDLFDPIAGSVSAGLYRFTAQYDDQGSPYCAVANAIPQGSLPLTSHGCISPFDYTDQQSTISGNTAFPTQCSSINAQIVYADYQTELQTATIDNTPATDMALQIAGQSDCSVSFWYRHEALIGSFGSVAVFGVEASTSGSTQFIQFGIGANGVPIVQMNGWDTSTAFSTNLKVTDGLFHFVQWSLHYDGSSYVFGFNLDGISYGTASNTVASFASSSPFVSHIDDLSPTSPDAEIEAFTFYPDDLLTVQQSSALHQCQLTEIGSGRCSTPGEQFILARQNVTQSNTTVCRPDGQQLSSKASFDTLFPIHYKIQNKFQQSGSIGFFVRAGALSVAGNTALISFASGVLNFQLNFISGFQVQIVVNDQTFTTTMIDSVTHYVVLTIQANTAMLYMDLQLLNVFSNLGAANNQGPSTYSVPSDNVFDTRIYDNVVLGISDIQNEALCQTSANTGIAQYLSPVGYCNVIAGTIYGYCRQPDLCNGHCQAFSIVDVNTHTFAPVTNECDAGYAAPDCLTRCARQDPITNACLDASLSSAVGATPGSVWCTALKFNRRYVNPSTSTFDLVPRRWQYTTSVTIPSGSITQVVNTGNCPGVAIVSALDGSYIVTLTNNDDSNSLVQITYAPDTVFSGDADCDAACCLLNTDQTVTVVAHATYSYSVPAANCGNMTIIVSQPSATLDPFSNSTSSSNKQCSKFSGPEVNALVQTAFNQPVSTAVQSKIDVALNQAAVGIRNVNAALGSSILQLFTIAGNVGIASDTFSVVLDQQQGVFNNISYSDVAFNTSNLPNFDVSKQLAALNSVVNDANAKSVAAAQQLTYNLASQKNISAYARQIQNDTALQILAAQADIFLAKKGMNVTLQQLAAIPDLSDFSDFGFPNLIQGIVDVAVKGVEAGVDGVKSIGSTVADAVGLGAGGIFSGITGAFSFLGKIPSLISGAIDFLINGSLVFAAVIVLYLLYKVGKHFVLPKKFLPETQMDQPRIQNFTDDISAAKEGISTVVGAMMGHQHKIKKIKKISRGQDQSLQSIATHDPETSSLMKQSNKAKSKWSFGDRS